ncbi:Mediator of RNA polymerase II transcription subunit 13 [Cladobotryum mycophilum]|uniref:Mediator of RNA polymerase II transcription subunit 13 n=1 Tax=Cladobotryum mycophilum TaxID=491253 RepID=A0ABR0SSL0_9HYPO
MDTGEYETNTLIIGIWYFRFLNKDGQESVDHESDNPIDAARHGLVLGEEGIIEPPTLQKVRAQAQGSNNTPTTLSPAVSALEQSQRHTLISPSQGIALGLHDQELRGAHPSIDTKSGGIPQKVLYENFVTSLLSTISTTFCHQTHAIPLNYRTILFPPNTLSAFESQDTFIEKYPVIGTFRAFLTTTGYLVLGLAVSRCKGLLCLDDVTAPGFTSQGQRILAAPFGVMTRSQFGIPGNVVTNLSHTPNAHAMSLRGSLETQESLWKQACLRYLHFRGISASALEHSHWVNLLVSRPRNSASRNDHRSLASASAISLPWPGRLCFRKRAVDVSSTSRVVDTVLSGYEETHDPLGSARGWFNATSERDEKVSKRNAERAATVLKETSIIEAKLLKPNGNSPMTIRRPSAAAAGVMYPTPPDGIQQVNGVTPSIDGALSSPGNPLSAPMTTELDNAAPNVISTGGTLDDSPEFVEPKRQQSDSNLLSDADNMFGDMGGDMFEHNDITEDDFNFFDEQPGGMDLDMSLSDLTATENITLPAPKIEEATPVPVEEAVHKPPPDPEPVVFAKPELKHARSCQTEDSAQRGRDVRPSSTKRESSPFDPHTVFKRVKASLGLSAHGIPQIAPASSRKTKVFERVDFDPTLPMISKKYEQGGFFDWSESSKTEKPKQNLGLLSDYPKRYSRSSKRAKDKPVSFSSVVVKSQTGMEPPILSSPSKLDGSISERDGSSDESDQDDSSYTSEEPSSPQKAALRHLNAEEDAVSQAASLRDIEYTEEPDHQFAVELPRLSKPDVSEMPLSVFFSDPEPLVLDMSLADEDLIQIAQILTEQAATGLLDICNSHDDSMAMMANQMRQALSTNTRNAFQVLEDVASHFLGEATPLRLKGLLDVQDIPLLPQPTRIAPRQIPGRETNSEPVRPSNLYQIPSPHLEVRRADVKLSVLPSAVTFWESLGLAPSSGTKNINAVCVFPGWNGMGDNVRTFLDRVKSVYEFLKLGTFENMALGQDLDDGLLPYEVDRISTSPDATVTGHGSALIESMDALRGPFSSLTITETNFVIYFVYSPGNPGTIVEACTAFQRFFETYQKLVTTKQKAPQNELVLQLVSMDFLSSPTSVVVTPAAELIKLCMETYDRCTLFGGPMPAPAIRIEQPLPRIIDFKLTNTASASLIRENSCIHISYAQSVDDRWVTAAWTDDRGNQQATASYCLGRKGKPQSRSMNEVAHEIWETTLELISVWKVHWRIIITKCGPMHQHEMEFWVDLARTEINATVNMILMTVDTNPSLQLLPPVMKLPGSATAFYTTPVSTPQANVVSPEQTTTPARDSSAAATTPGDNTAVDTDADAVLADVTDQTWGAVASHRLSNSTSILEVQPALISGYLIKKTGMRVEDAPVVMEVNLVHTETMPRAYEPLLREMLSHFRGLGTLARARGVVDREADARPWHVAAAEKAVRALYLLM